MIRIVRPSIGEEEVATVREVLTSGFLTQGRLVVQFEERLAAVIGARHVIAVSSGTAALHLALLALEVGPGDEVVTSAFTFPATVNVIELVGATPVLVDIDLTTYTMNPSWLERAITPRTKAIVPVHEFGLMADMATILQVAERHGVLVIEDAACALGANQSVDDRVVRAGSAGTVGCFSFHPRKSITTGEGGCLTTEDKTLAWHLRALRNHGFQGDGEELDLPRPGLNYRMSEIQAGMGLVQVTKLDSMLAERRRLTALYQERLERCKWLRLPYIPKGWTHTFQSYVVLVPEYPGRKALIEWLRAKDIESVRGAYAVHRLRYYREKYKWAPEAFPAASAAHDRALALPLYPGMPDEAVDQVAECLVRAWS